MTLCYGWPVKAIDKRLEAAAMQLVGAYYEVHPELGLREALTAATILAGGIDLATLDDGAGRLTVTDEAGRQIVVLDLSPWLPRREADGA